MEDHQISGNDINKELNPRQLQLFVKLLNGRTLSLQFPTPQVHVGDVKHRIQEITQIPIDFHRLIRGHQLNDESVISQSNATLNFSLRLLGGKGGFGSLLRGAATKAGQKKTNNFEACRDMSGRRLRHVNAEKRLEEWKAEEEQRKLEKMAEDFIKKKAKTGKKGVGDVAAEKYVAKYREESARCVAVVEESVRAACQNRKRKAVPGGADPKKLKIWMGKSKVVESDSDYDDSSEDEEENEKSVVLNNGNHSDYSKATEGSSGSVSGGNHDIEISGGASSETGSEEGKEVVVHQSSESCGEDANAMVEADVIAGNEQGQAEMLEHYGIKTEDPVEIVSQHFNVPVAETEDGNKLNNEVNCSSNPESGVCEETVVSNANIAEPEKPLNFDDFNSSEEMEILGLERLKSELQARGLKCGGTLQERAARLFLLKSTPFNKLPKKLLAKK
ncbi:Autophagy 6 isoform 1 [Hibiscus syriacus]|uniref:Autophagy 6 isoform 1 n=1 Tax=Hibiscus syriacus TaxID=106335 RepID=A0A6A2WU32_HIBSY|nr:replication stress response regulator SDE2-like [Hibiscus syriacus]XP_039043588.1 replication stress response regulator SDE2-like [Hibiscus syriacus]KAE8664913.1 Autophagy 6 isoform 1 [Hibiscus syriacus]